jgi:hypothetical protein
MSQKVNVDNFARAESDHMFASLAQQAGGTGKWKHFREPSPIDNQPVIRQNRDTLYSVCVADISQGGTLTLPDSGERYISAMIVNQDHYINRVFHSAGTYDLTVDEFDTPYVLLAVRILVNPEDPKDIAAVNALQDQISANTNTNTEFVLPDYDRDSYLATRNSVIELARGVESYTRAFGRRDEVDPVRHLLGTAAGWGGLPDAEAKYINVDPGLPIGEFKIEVGEVPVDAFWSISLYNKEGYFEKNKRDLYNINSIIADRNPDGSVTVNFGTSDADKPNYFPIMDGWNYLVRLYRPRTEVQSGEWTFPAIQPS